MNANDLVLESVNERDIDVLLVEELTVCEPFARWFIAQATQTHPAVHAILRVQRSVCNPHGETDILIVFESNESHSVALLVENKISAPPQPEQAARYRLRGKHGVASCDWDDFYTCIIAPAKYLLNSRNTDGYMAQFSYEAIRDWFAANSEEPVRGKYRALIIDEAINQNRRGYTKLIDDTVSTFWNQYWNLAKDEFPELRLSRPDTRPSKSFWIQFPNAKRPKGCCLQHKADRGVVHLELRGRASEMGRFVDAKEDIIPDGIDIVLASKSLALSINVTPLNHAEDFESQEENVREGLRAASLLLSFANSSDGLELLLK